MSAIRSRINPANIRKGPGATRAFLCRLTLRVQRGVLPIVFGVVLIGSVDGVIVVSVVDVLGIVLGDDIVPLRVLRRVDRVVVVVDGVLMVELVDIVLLVLGDVGFIVPIVPVWVPIVPVWVPIVPVVVPVPIVPPAVPPVVCAEAIAGSASATAASGIM